MRLIRTYTLSLLLAVALPPATNAASPADELQIEVSYLKASSAALNNSLKELKVKLDEVEKLQATLESLSSAANGSAYARSQLGLTSEKPVENQSLLLGCSKTLQEIYQIQQRIEGHVRTANTNAQKAKELLDQNAQAEPSSTAKLNTATAAAKTLETAKLVCRIGRDGGQLEMALKGLQVTNYNDAPLRNQIEEYDRLVAQLAAEAVDVSAAFDRFVEKRLATAIQVHKAAPSADLPSATLDAYKADLLRIKPTTEDAVIVVKAEELGKSRLSDVSGYRVALKTVDQSAAKTTGETKEMCDTAIRAGDKAKAYADTEGPALKNWVGFLAAGLLQRAVQLENWSRQNGDNRAAAEAKLKEAAEANNPENAPTIEKLNNVISDSKLYDAIISGEETAIHDAIRQVNSPQIMRAGFTANDNTCN